jgi:hypothetical protein
LVVEDLAISLHQASHVVLLFSRRHDVETMLATDFEGEGLGLAFFEAKT